MAAGCILYVTTICLSRVHFEWSYLDYSHLLRTRLVLVILVICCSLILSWLWYNDQRQTDCLHYSFVIRCSPLFPPVDRNSKQIRVRPAGKDYRWQWSRAYVHRSDFVLILNTIVLIFTSDCFIYLEFESYKLVGFILHDLNKKVSGYKYVKYLIISWCYQLRRILSLDGIFNVYWKNKWFQCHVICGRYVIYITGKSLLIIYYVADIWCKLWYLPHSNCYFDVTKLGPLWNIY